MEITVINVDEFNLDNIKLSKITNHKYVKKKISIGCNNNNEFYLLTPTFINHMDFHNNIKYSFIEAPGCNEYL